MGRTHEPVNLAGAVDLGATLDGEKAGGFLNHGDDGGVRCARLFEGDAVSEGGGHDLGDGSHFAMWIWG